MKIFLGIIILLLQAQKFVRVLEYFIELTIYTERIFMEATLLFF